LCGYENISGDITGILLQISETIKELNAVNYDIFRIINDDWSKLSEEDSQLLMTSMKMTQRLLENEKLSNLEGKKYSGDIAESIRLLGELKDYIMQLKLRRTYYELKESLTERNPSAETYAERQAKIQASRKKLRDNRKKNE
jgi:hypothetical protein